MRRPAKPTAAATLAATGPETLVVRAVTAVLSALGSPALPPLGAPAQPPDEGIVAIGAAADGADRRLGLERAEGVQAEDAVLKAVALAALAVRLGGVEALLALPSGAAWIAVWGAVDVAATLGAVQVAPWAAPHRLSAQNRLVAALGEDVLRGVDAAFAELVPRLQAAVDAALPALPRVTSGLAPLVPGLIAPGPDATARVGARADGLPIYLWLAARMAIERAQGSTP